MPTIEKLQNYPLSTDLATQAELDSVASNCLSGIQMNGSLRTVTNKVADLGTVISSHQQLSIQNDYTEWVLTPSCISADNPQSPWPEIVGKRLKLIWKEFSYNEAGWQLYTEDNTPCGGYFGDLSSTELSWGSNGDWAGNFPVYAKRYKKSAVLGDQTAVDLALADHTHSLSDIANVPGVMQTGSYNDLLDKPTIPHNTSQLTNDSGFLTAHQSLSGYLPLTGGIISSDTFKWVSTDGQTNMLSVNTFDGTYALGNCAEGGAVAVAIGTNAKATIGSIAIGGVNAWANANNSIQIGTGTNTTAGTTQIKNWQLLDANGNIPYGRLSAELPSSYLSGVRMNGSLKAVTNKVVDLGTVLTAHQDISEKADKAELTNYILSSQFSSLSVDINNVKITKSVQTAETVYDYAQGSEMGYVSDVLTQGYGSLESAVAYPLSTILEYGYTLDELSNAILNNSDLSWVVANSDFSLVDFSRVYGYNKASNGLSADLTSLTGYWNDGNNSLVNISLTSQYGNYFEWKNQNNESVDGTPRGEIPAKYISSLNVFRQPIIGLYVPENSTNSYVSFVFFKDYNANQTGSHTEYHVTTSTIPYDSDVSSTYATKDQLSSYLEKSNVAHLNTSGYTAQPVNSNEELTGTIYLHKISKTGSYNDLLNKPDLTKYVELSALNSLPLSSYTYLSTTTNISNDIQAAVVHKAGNETLSGDLYLSHQIENRFYDKYVLSMKLPKPGAPIYSTDVENLETVRVIFDEHPLSQLYYTGDIAYTMERYDGNTVLSSQYTHATKVYGSSPNTMCFYFTGLWYKNIWSKLNYFELNNVSADTKAAIIASAQDASNNGSTTNKIKYYKQAYTVNGSIVDYTQYTYNNWNTIRPVFNDYYNSNENINCIDRFIQESDLEKLKWNDFENFKKEIRDVNLYYKIVSPEVSGITSISVDLEDRAINALTVDDSTLSATITFPNKIQGYARDFFVRLTVTGSNIPTFIFQEPDGSSISFDVIENDWANIEQGVNILMFTETAQ